MEQEVGKNETTPNVSESDQQTKLSQVFDADKMDQLLQMIGLTTPFDYLFLFNAQVKNREFISKFPGFTFLFNIKDPEGDDEFPHGAFLERRKVNDETIYMIWILSPSKKYSSRVIHPFHDFGLYFEEKMRDDLDDGSIDGIYKTFDYHLADGKPFYTTTPDPSPGKRRHVLYTSGKKLFTFIVPDLTPEEYTNTYMCNWVSASEPVAIRELEECEVFEMMQERIFPEPNHTVVVGEEQPINMEQDYEQKSEN